MADLSDIETSLATVVDAVRVAQGASWIIFRGWPSASTLDAALNSGQVQVSIWPDSGIFRELDTPEPREWALTPVAPTLTVSVAGDVATFAGVCSTDQIAGLRTGSYVWAVRCGSTDTPVTIAGSLAAASGGTASGAAVTLAGLSEAKTGRDVVMVRQTRWQIAGIKVIVWAPTPQLRDTVASAIDGYLSSDLNAKLTMPDGTLAVVRGGGSLVIDTAQEATLYRRDLRYRVQFITTTQTARTPALWPGLTYQPGNLRLGDLAWPVDLILSVI